MSTDELARLTYYTTLGALAINVLLAALTGVYVFFTRQMVTQMRAAREPSVYLDLEFPDREARVVIGNSGQLPALNVRFDVKEDLPWLLWGGKADGLQTLDVVQTGVSFLPPGRVLKYMAGYIDWKKLRGGGGRIEVEISFENEAGQSFSRQYQIDAAQYVKVLVESYRDSSADVAKAIRDTEESRQTQESMKGISRQLFGTKTKCCPICAESIPKAAKKCPKCHEFIEQTPT